MMIRLFSKDKKDKATELIRKLKTRGYFCTKCKNWHTFEDDKYKKHVMNADEVLS